MLFNHDSGLIQSIITIDTTVAPTLGGSNTLQIIGTGGLILPVGGSATRPASPVAGTQRYNTDLSKVEYFNGSAWIEGSDGTVTSITVTSADIGGLTVNGGGTATITDSGSIEIALDPTLVNLAKSLPSTSGGPVVRLANDTFISRVFTAVAPVGITNGDGVNGDPEITVNAELVGLSTQSAVGYTYRNSAGVYTNRTLAVSGDLTLDTTGNAVTFGYTPAGDVASLIAAGTGVIAKTATGTYTGREIVGTGSIVVTNGDGVDGNPTISYTAGANLAGLEALSGLGYVVQTGTATFANRQLVGTTAVQAGNITITEDAATAGNTVIAFTAGTEVAGIAALGTSGMVARTAAGTYTGRTLTGSTSDAGVLSFTNGDGITAAPQVVFTPTANLAALSTTTAVGLLSRDVAGVYTGKTVTGTGSIVVTYIDDTIEVSYTAGANLGALDAMTGTGIMVRTGASTYENRAVTGTAGQIDVANGSGVSGAPTVALASVTQDTESGTFSKVTLDSYGRVVGNTPVVTADITALVDDVYLNVTGDTMAGTLNMGGFGISNLLAPVSGSDATTKNYVDAMSAGLSWKQSVKAATTGNITLSGAQTVDGVTLVDGDRVLVRAQTLAVDNGIWIYSAAGAWDRSEDLNSPQESKAATMFIEQGATHADTAWTQTSEVVVIGSDPLSFTQFAGAGAFTAGTGLTLTGNSFAITSPVVTSLGGTGLTSIGSSGQVLAAGEAGLEYKTLTAGAGVALTNAAGEVTFANTGVLSASAGTGITVDKTTGNLVITNAGVLSVAVAGSGSTGISASTTDGVVTLTGSAVTSVTTSGAGITASAPVNGVVTIANTGITSVGVAGTGVSVATVDGVLTITGSATAVEAGLGITVAQTGGLATVSNTGVVSITGVNSLSTSFDSATGITTVTNDGITSAVAGTGITVSNDGIGASTIANDGVLTVAVSGTGLTGFTAAKGVVSIVGTGVDSIGTVTGVTASITAGALSIANTGVVSLAGTTNQVTVSNTGTAYTVGLPASVTIDTALTVTGLGADKVLTTGAAGVVQGTSLLDGQFIIGATGAAPAAGVIAAGTGITVTNSPNGISIAVAGGVALNSVTGLVKAGSTTALNVFNAGTTSDPTIEYGVDAGLESLAALATYGLVVQSADDTFVTRSLVAGNGVSIVNVGGVAGDITIANTGVTSVALALPSIFDVSNSPVTTTGTLTAALVSQPQATVFAAPATGSGTPTFRALVPSDLGLNLYRENSVTAVAPSATGDNSIAFGSASAATLTGQIAHASGQFATAGDAQSVEMVLRGATADATANELFLNGTSLQALLPANTAWNFTVQIVGRRVGGGAAAAYRFDGIIVKDTLASSTAFVGIPSKVILGETSIPWDAAVIADVASGALKITATGEAATDVKWVATIRATQVIC